MRLFQQTVRIGTRGSLLALAQAKETKRLLEKKNPGVRFELIVVKTTGDRFRSLTLFNKNNIGVFTKTLEERLLQKKIDIAVHSLKDLPTQISRRLVLGAFPKRLIASDALVSQKRFSLKTLPWGARVGTGSPRRKRQIAMFRPDLQLVDLRGNLNTRVAKVLESKELDAVVVAEAGLRRVGKYLKYAKRIPVSQILPAVGQASLALEVRKSDDTTLRLAQKLNHAPTEMAVMAERSFLKVLEGGCRVPVGIYSSIKNGRLRLKAAVFSTENQDFLAGDLSGPVRQAKALGKNLAKRLLAKGARRFLRQARTERGNS